jgi:hypothetical protein
VYQKRVTKRISNAAMRDIAALVLLYCTLFASVVTSFGLNNPALLLRSKRSGTRLFSTPTNPFSDGGSTSSLSERIDDSDGSARSGASSFFSDLEETGAFISTALVQIFGGGSKGNRTFRTYYTVLGVEEDATVAEIKVAFRRLMKTMHPDAQPIVPSASSSAKLSEEGEEGGEVAEVSGEEDGAAFEAYQEVIEAYKVLSNEQLRAECT